MLLHYTALLFDDREDVRRYQEHTDDLTQGQVCEMLIADMRSKGVTVAEPADPLTDTAFIAMLTDFYAMAPEIYPAEAPLEKR